MLRAVMPAKSSTLSFGRHSYIIVFSEAQCVFKLKMSTNEIPRRPPPLKVKPLNNDLSSIFHTHVLAYLTLKVITKVCTEM